MKFRIFITSLLFLLGFKPNKEIYADNYELIGCGYFRFKDKMAYYHGYNAYLFPITSKIWDKVQKSLIDRKFGYK